MRKIRILSLVMALLLVAVSFASCAKTKTVVYQDIDDNDAVEHTDFTSVYDMIGSKVTIDMVTEDENGKAFVEYEGVKYELGMDFLSMAMVYNVTVPEGSSKYKTADDVFNEWWKLYIQRWNYLVCEVPLYSNQYFDLYNGKIEGFATTPYWGPADAIVAATVKSGEANSVILGSSTDLSGAFRNSSWGKSSPSSSDLDIQNLVSGYATVQTDKSGSYIWNMQALAEIPTSVVNEDGTITFTIKVKEGMKFSDESPITAKNYIAALLSNSTAVAQAAGGTGNSGMTVVGFDEFSKYTGEGDKVYFSGVKLLDDYTFSVTLTADYAGYYYAMGNAGFSPDPLALYLGDADIIVNDNKECGLSDEFYKKETVEGVDTYVTAAKIKDNMKWNSAIPYSGPYTVTNYDESTLTATLKLNPVYPGDDARGKASIETITYVKVVSETQMDQFTTGKVDVIAGITGGDDTKAALKIVSESNGKFAETHYDRAGYGKLGFRADFGPTGMTEVRQAIMYTINRPEFAQTFTGGYGSVVHGPYYEGFSAFQANKNTIKLNQYAYSADSAIAVLEAAGWIYNEKGESFKPGTDAVRYKKLSGYELSKDNLHFATTDGKYKTVKIDGNYYMPLAINWYGTQPNNVTDQLLTAWQTNENATTKIGMYIVYVSCDFSAGVYGELCRMDSYGYDGTPKCNAINFATGFNSAMYDYSWNWTINPDFYDDYSACYVLDAADFYADYAK
ncbi:MAG: ABC transporter substrate-binding protein [Lachnospiraceae bacterium]|nr:ABC transporter substrate-binding protein [Lachnospiraceae bacterium]